MKFNSAKPGSLSRWVLLIGFYWRWLPRGGYWPMKSMCCFRWWGFGPFELRRFELETPWPDYNKRRAPLPGRAEENKR